MADVVSPQARSRMMSGIRGRDTKPELALRKALFARGFRYRLNDRRLPGKPDLVLPKYGAAIFVHGCFWHRHDCHLFKWPKTTTGFWREKISGNRERDERTRALLKAAGWRIMIVWECAIKGKTKLDFEHLVDAVASWITGGENGCEIAGVEPAER